MNGPTTLQASCLLAFARSAGVRDGRRMLEVGYALGRESAAGESAEESVSSSCRYARYSGKYI